VTNTANQCIVIAYSTYHFVAIQPHILLDVCLLLMLGIYEFWMMFIYPIGIHIFYSKKFSTGMVCINMKIQKRYYIVQNTIGSWL